ncbi:galactose ABC transporter substrate-binding protein [Oribacterium sinus]|uniref:galactose ABC transporter substrate-binding protein n=1 Tax=Oribacterium sinus TaxID=237576 RepID=UPI0028D157B2|nr:galactose ABC transporter substrate-binding protein [Oribacterium sinus]
MKRILSTLTVSALAVSMLAACGSSNAGKTTTAAAEQKESAKETEKAMEGTKAAVEEMSGDFSDKKVGVCIYQFSDNFMTLFRTELENYLVSKGFKKENIKIMDGANDQATQTNQIENFITDKVDVLIVNPVNSSSAATITDKVQAAGIPLVYINREPDQDEEKRWEEKNWDVTYVGCDARQSGTFQGEIIASVGMDKLDMNGNGKVDYIMIKGDPENIDAQYRTEFSVKALQDAGMEVNKLDEQVGNWDQALAQSLVANALAKNGKDIEVVFCNNDSMALGALQAIQAAGRTVGKDIYLVGVDALEEACQNVLAGTQTGTVFNDFLTQSHAAGDAAINYLSSKGNDHYIGCDYVKVTKDNAQDILKLLK